FASQTFECLRAIDTGAPPLPSGKPTGLCWYQGFLRYTTGRSTKRHEESWFPPLISQFVSRGVGALPECRYPPPERYCDLVLSCPDLGRVWLEIKGAWRY